MRTPGREYAFITIFAKNRINGSIRADVYTFAIFPLDSTEYGTYTDTDIALDTPLNPGKLTAADRATSTSPGRAATPGRPASTARTD